MRRRRKLPYVILSLLCSKCERRKPLIVLYIKGGKQVYVGCCGTTLTVSSRKRKLKIHITKQLLQTQRPVWVLF